MPAVLPAATLLYDADCGFCQSIVNWISRQERGSKIHAMPCQFAVSSHAFPVTESDCRNSIHVFDLAHTQSIKAEAVATVLAILWDSKAPLRIARLPGMKQVLDIVYILVAANRHRIPGIKQWCAIDRTQKDQS